MMKSKWWILVLCTCLAAGTAAAAGPGYHVVTTYKVGGEGGWDYLTADASARRLYISRGTHVIVLDLDSGKNLGNIPDTPGVHGIALGRRSWGAVSRATAEKARSAFSISRHWP